MTPREKAEELVSEMYSAMEEYALDFMAEKCALIAVDEIIEATIEAYDDYYVQYWQEVKNEIEKL